MSTVPSTYLDPEGKPPPKLDPDARAMFTLAANIYARLSPTMRRSLTAGWYPDGSPRWAIPGPTLDALEARGLAPGDGARGLTPLGLLVREAGTRTPAGETDHG